jgi:hypothetical protein
MKTHYYFSLVLMLTFIALNIPARATTVSAGQVKTETFKVWGKCDTCKERIEDAAKAAGASGAKWSDKTLMLTVTFDPSVTSKDVICKKIAAAGHDTEKFKAPDDVYNKLPGCCHYERAK